MILKKTANPEPVSGIMVVDKPSGWTSHDVVNRVRYLLGGVKTGHAGTLDPMATGVMILLIGRATKLSSRFMREDKRYLAEVTFGHSTDTFDALGKTVATGDPGEIDVNMVAQCVQRFKGESEQIPPMFSAVKTGGRRLYHIARSGKTVERKARKIFISSIEADLSRFPVARLDILCSSGTYIRSIANELGEMTRCPAHLSALRRIAAGSHVIEDAIDFADVHKAPEAPEILRKSILPIPETIHTL